VSLPDRCGTVPVGRKDLNHGLFDRLFCPCLWTAAIGRPVPLGGKSGGKIVKRGPDVVAASGRLALWWSHLVGPVTTALEISRVLLSLTLHLPLGQESRFRWLRSAQVA
jgi:hypothetical protein